jgi:hypothetical protein
MKKAAVLFISVLMLAACGGMKSAVKKGEIAPVFNDTVTDGSYLWVRGFGAANPQHSTSSQRRIMSREAAIAQGYQRATEYIYGSGVTAAMRVKDAVAENSVIENTVKGLVAGMEVFETRYLDDEGCAVIMRLPLKKLESAGIKLESK